MTGNKNMSVLFAFAILAFGLQTGCPDDDDCPSGDPCLCYGICPDGGDADADNGSDADSDANSDADAEGADDSGADSDASANNITGDWYVTYRNSETGAQSYWHIHLDQTDTNVIGWEWDGGCDYTGSISTAGYVSLVRDCSTRDRTVTGNLVNPDRMEGNWYEETTPPPNDWWAVRE